MPGAYRKVTGMNKLLQTLSLSALVAIAGAAFAADFSEGEVRKVDKAAGKVTLKHGDIKNLGMGPMTMVFTAKDPKILDKVKAGDKVKFVAASEGGKLIVTEIQPAK